MSGSNRFFIPMGGPKAHLKLGSKSDSLSDARNPNWPAPRPLCHPAKHLTVKQQDRYMRARYTQFRGSTNHGLQIRWGRTEAVETAGLTTLRASRVNNFHTCKKTLT